MAIPDRHPRTSHFDPYWYNDSLPGLRRAARLDYRYADQDINLTKGDPDSDERSERPVAVVKHWNRRSYDGFTHIWTGKYTAQGKEIRRPYRGPALISKIPFETVRLLRRGDTGPGRYREISDHAAECERLGIKMCAELKDSPNFEHQTVAEDIYFECFNAGQVPYIMTLSTLGGPRLAAARRLKAFKAVGFETALLPRGGKPDDFNEKWAPHIDAMWGTRQNPNWAGTG